MAELTERDRKIFETLTREERQKFWLLHERDVDLKNQFIEDNLEWDNESDSAALAYLRKKVKKDGSSFSENAVFEPKVEEEASASVDEDKNALRESNDTEDFPDTSTDSDEQFSDAETVEVSETFKTCTQLRDFIDGGQASCAGELQAKIKVYPKTTLRGVVELRGGRNGLYKQIVKGYVSGWEVVVKTINKSEKDMGEKEIRVIRSIYGLNHRNVISMIGILDSGIDQPMKLIFDYRDFDTNLLEFLRDFDDTNPKDYATLGKFSLDITNACEYLHKKGVVHGSLGARNVIIRTAKSKYDTKFKTHIKTHFNALLSDYGIINLTNGVGCEFFKASNGKVVPLRWVPEEILKSDIGSIDYTLQSDVWSFGVVLWEMWTHGQVPYGNMITNSKVQAHILNGCSPLTFQKPNGCPPHILKVMENIFVEADKRPTMADLVKTFEDFRSWRKKEQLKEDSKEKNVMKNLECEWRQRDKGAPYRYENQNPHGPNMQPEVRSNQNQRLNNRGGGGARVFRRSSDKAWATGNGKIGLGNISSKNATFSKSRLVPVLWNPTQMSLYGNSNNSTPFTSIPAPINSLHTGMQMQTMQSSIVSLQHQLHTLSCTVSRGHAPPSSSSVSVSIDNQQPSTNFNNPSQRPVPSLSQSGQTRQEPQGRGFGNAAASKRKPKNNKKQQNNKIQ